MGSTRPSSSGRSFRRSSAPRSRAISMPAARTAPRSPPAASVIGNQGYFIEPTVLTETNRDMQVVREEIFGPVVCVQSFDDDDLDSVANRQRHRIRSCGQHLDARYQRRASLARDQGRHGAASTRRIMAIPLALRRLQAVRLGPGNGQGSDGALHRDKSVAVNLI